MFSERERTPILNIFVGLSIRHIVHEEDALCTPVVRRANCFKPLLSCCVPNLQLQSFAADGDRLHFEVDADSGDETGGKFVVTVSQQDATLAHTGVAD